MKGHVIAEISIVPVGTGDTGLGHYVAACIEVLEGRKDISYRLTPMGTIIEGPLDKVLEVIQKMHEVPFNEGASRVVTFLKIDDRRDKPSTMAGKIESVMKLRPSIKT
ncbi:MTH1187 family thiamine-binding protein [Chloroflexota bacterium]